MENIHDRSAQAQHAQIMFLAAVLVITAKPIAMIPMAMMHALYFSYTYVLITVSKPTVTTSTAVMLCHNTCGNEQYYLQHSIYSRNITYNTGYMLSVTLLPAMLIIAVIVMYSRNVTLGSSKTYVP